MVGLEVKLDGTSNYDSQANQEIAKNLKGHLLLTHGTTMDDNVPPNNTLLVVDVHQASQDDENLRPLRRSLRGLIQQAGQQALRAVDVVQVQTCWEIGRHIVEFEQNGATRAEYGKRLLPALAAALTRDFGKGLTPPIFDTCEGFSWPSRFATHCVAN